MEKRLKKKWIAVSVLCSILLSSIWHGGPMETKAATTITLDGNLSDWKEIPSQKSADTAVSFWKVAQDDAYLYFAAEERYATPWYHPVCDQTVILEYPAKGNLPDTLKNKSQILLKMQDSVLTVKDFWWNPVDGASAAMENISGTEGQADDVNTFEWKVPKAFLADQEFTLKFCNYTVAKDEIPLLDTGKPPLEEEKPPAQEEWKPAYEGITIDGAFQDWEAIEKTKVNQYAIAESAMVWDGDQIYIYFLTTGENWEGVEWSGPKGNGKFYIKTDLGRELLFQPKKENGEPKVIIGDITTGNYIYGEAKVNTTEWGKGPYIWEISIPASALPDYDKTISVGYYKEKPFIPDVANLQEKEEPEEETKPSVGTMATDGIYEEWEGFPHQHLDHASAGTAEHVVDAEAALYAKDNKLYGHVDTAMKAHVNFSAQDFTEGIILRVSEGEPIEENKLQINPRFVTADEKGNINWHPQIDNLEKGTYHFYIFDTSCWGTSANINNLEIKDVLYGEAMITLDETKTEMEFFVDIDVLTQHLKMGSQGTAEYKIDPDRVKQYCIYYDRLGKQWITCAGTSTGTWTGLLICFGAVGMAGFVQRKRKKSRIG